MRPSFRFAPFRVAPFRVVLALTTAIGTVLQGVPLAQAQDAATATPPERVGQIALVQGSVSFDSAGASQWSAAALNYPVTSGDALYTQPGAEAAVAIDWSRMTLNEATELQVTTIGPQVVDAALSQGEVYVDVRNLAPGASYAITTPRGTVTIARDGQYDIVAGDQTAPTTVTVISGAAQLQGQNVSLDIAPGETATLQGADPVTAALGAGQRDPFVVRLLAVRYAPAPAYVPPVVNQMTGGYQLAEYGSWSQTPQYGAVWYPRVASSWVPYREGHWAYVAPWGWTWVDNDPWGFAPFHYGRWVQYGGRWGWAPAPVAYDAPAYYQPVYAPATVSFFNVGTGVAIGVGITAAAFAVGSIGWVPLGPDEPYRPWYHCPPRYVQRVNYYNIRNPNHFTDIHNTTIINNYGPARLINRGAATVLPADAMRRGDPVGRFGRPAPGAVLAAARPVPPAGFRGPVAHPGGPGFGKLPGAPGAMIHRIAAQAPRPAPFAASRGLPVARPAPIRPAAIRPQIHVMPRGPNVRPGVMPQVAHPMPAAIGRPMQPGGMVHMNTPQAPRPPVGPARPGAVRPPQMRPQIRTPQVRPQYHPPVQQARPQPQQFHPAPRPQQFHPPAQQARPVARAPQYHPPAQQFHPAPRPAARPAPRPAPGHPDQQHP
ncbi:MAG: hypothetical protein B7Z58_16040 [Acidiphilium sp. 37-64-53]|uniref:DUF6600 domain-containing protein n=1 Tax=Acidiphilium sp. TaxID=527 RepID=UPI000BC8C2AC|nr:DUF6600 domain-containing protein [Acidiphilium sp.]OYW00282.1 MAG: hypothetical protein B7Z58_16040 [Acidiphilium sp. 37-64-53]OZB24609.1 MAG: hypothetical protein B7X49_14695 [Acidiphilium sp. 34-64-41]HQT86588.1 hypothetical protein [Acidiphilium rubrum]